MKAKLSTYSEVLNWASSFLEVHQREPHAAKRLLLDMQDWSQTDLLMHLSDAMPAALKTTYLAHIEAHEKGVPIQHLTGFEYFYGRKFKVTEDTLIPRPETEELVEKCLALTKAQQHLRVLDIGTGSGIIAITLKKERPDFNVSGTDISESALEVAQENARNLAADIQFFQGDLIAPVKQEKFDVIISNPPYIPESDKLIMEDIVLEHEPHTALFAAENGLAIYQRLAKELSTVLKPEGLMLFEIGYNQGEAVKTLMKQSFPAADVYFEKDISGNDRIVVVAL